MVTRSMLKRLVPRSKGFTLIELLIVVAIIRILAAIAIPNLLSAQKKSKYARAASDTKTATTQGIVYSNDNNNNPGTLAQLRTAGYANVDPKDPWGIAYNLSSAFQVTTTPAATGKMGVCSKGPSATPTDAFCVAGFNKVYDGTVAPTTDGSVGYSSIYGSWQGKA